MTSQSGSGGASGTAGGALTGTYPSPSISNGAAVLAAPVTMTNANQFYDAVTLNLAAGTWLLLGKAQYVTGGAAGTMTARLTDGTTTFGNSSVRVVSTSIYGQVEVHALAVLAAPSTIHLAAACDVAGYTIGASGDANAPGAVATQLLAVRLA